MRFELGMRKDLLKRSKCIVGEKWGKKNKLVGNSITN